MNKRDTLLNLINSSTSPDYVPAALFLHFDPEFHQGQAAIDKHLEFFRATGMDLVKIQFEQLLPSEPHIAKPNDWRNAPRYTQASFDPTVRVVEGLLKAAQSDALVVLTLYSPFMWAKHMTTDEDLRAHFREDPEAVEEGLAIMTENVLNLVRACKRAGVDGFYASSQGGESFRFPGTDIFKKYIKPTDLAVWDEIRSCRFNILHICDFEGSYDDLTPFLDYPGHVVNCSLHLGDRTLTPKQFSEMFARPFMGGMERTGILATGSREEIRRAARNVLAQAPDRFILGADCTVPGTTPWLNLKTAIDAAHEYRQ